MFFADIARLPDSVTLFSEAGSVKLECSGQEWHTGDVTVETVCNGGHLDIVVTAERSAVERLKIRWRGETPVGVRILGDHWERGYGDLEWRGVVPERVMPWYFLACDGSTTCGCGVKTGALPDVLIRSSPPWR